MKHGMSRVNKATKSEVLVVGAVHHFHAYLRQTLRRGKREDSGLHVEIDSRMKPEIIIEHDFQLTQMHHSSRACTKLSHVSTTSVSSRCFNGNQRVKESNAFAAPRIYHVVKGGWPALGCRHAP